jgi:pimeloyl-ACP methyl ester carboxylesterase
MNPVLIVLGLAAVGAGLWHASLAIEAMRRAPKPPSRLPWAPEIPIEMIDVGGHRLRFIKAGQGPSLVLLHTLRTQLDLFEKVVPELSRHFTVYALDYPGHGFSDIPRARYDAAFFTAAVEGFIERLELRDVTLAGVSIGGATSLIIAARRNPRIARVVAVNPYDYAKGRGMARISVLGWLVTHASRLPVIGAFHWIQAALRLPLERGSRVLISSSGAALQGSPLSGGYAGAKRMMWMMADYANGVASDLGVDVRFQALLVRQIVGATELGRTAAEAYARQKGVSLETFLAGFGKPLIPRDFGEYVIALLTDPKYENATAFGIRGDTGVELPAA